MLVLDPGYKLKSAQVKAIKKHVLEKQILRRRIAQVAKVLLEITNATEYLYCCAG